MSFFQTALLVSAIGFERFLHFHSLQLVNDQFENFINNKKSLPSLNGS